MARKRGRRPPLPQGVAPPGSKEQPPPRIEELPRFDPEEYLAEPRRREERDRQVRRGEQEREQRDREASQPTQNIIPGGIDVFGRVFEPFIIGDEHTLFEWAMIYQDRHPAAVHPAHLANTTEDRHLRYELLGDDSDIGRAVFDALAADEAGRIKLRREVYCKDRPGQLDLTLCVIDKAPVLALARRRRDYGRFIAALIDGTALQAGTIAAEKKCQQWLVNLMKGPPTKKRDEYKTEAIKEFKVSDRGFLRAWANAIAEAGNTDWSKRGRKSQRRIDTHL